MTQYLSAGRSALSLAGLNRRSYSMRLHDDFFEWACCAACMAVLVMVATCEYLAWR